MEDEETERECGDWQEVPSPLWTGALQAAARRELENRGFNYQQGNLISYRQPTRKKPPLPPTHTTTDSLYFGVALSAQQPRLLLDPLDRCGQGVWLPRVFVECVCVLRRNLTCPGLFRRAGSVTRQRAMRVSLESGEQLSSPNPHDIASILKQYLRELPSPLLPPSLHPTLEGAWLCEERRERVEVVMCALLQLPQPHLQMLKELSCLLSAVADHESQSLMDSYSLAVVMTPNIMPSELVLEKTLTTNTGIVQLIIDHAPLIGLAPPHIINHAHQLAKEGVASKTGSNESLDEIKKKKRGSVTDRVLGWGTKLMNTIGSVSRDQATGSRDQDHTQSPGSTLDSDGPPERLFHPSFPPSLPPHLHTPKSQHKRRRSFLGTRRHTDGRHGHKSLFSNPFRGSSRGEFLRRGVGRCSEHRFPWLQRHTPSTPNPNVQLVGFGFKPTLTGERGMSDNDRGTPDGAHILANSAALTPVVGNDILLASVSQESVHTALSGKRREGEEGRGGGEEGVDGEVVGTPEAYDVARKPSVKRMRCETEGGEEGRMVKRRHTIYSSQSREDTAHSTTIRTSKSATTLRTDPDPCLAGFVFSRPTPHTQRTPVSVPMETDTGISEGVAPSKTPFKFSAPRRYAARKTASAEGSIEDDTKCTLFKDDVIGGVCGASPIPYLPELSHHKGTRQDAVFSAPPSSPKGAPRSQLNEGFLLTPFPPHSPNLLDKIRSELVDRYPMATPLATPTDKEAWLTVNESYRQAVYVQGGKQDCPLPLAKPAALEFNASFSHDDTEGSKVMQEVSFSFKLNSASNRHSNTTQPPPGHARIPLSPINHSLPPRTPAHHLKPPKIPLQRKFAMTPFLSHCPQFTDISSSPSCAEVRATGKTPKINKRAQMYVIPSSSSSASGCDGVHVKEWML